MSRFWGHTWVLALGLSAGCMPPGPSPTDAAHGDAAGDRTARADSSGDVLHRGDGDVGVDADDCNGCGGSIRCPSGAHVDCVAPMSCSSRDQPYVTTGAPVNACTQEEAVRLLRMDICSVPYVIGRSSCPGPLPRCSATRRDPRYARCQRITPTTPYVDHLLGQLCEQQPSEGSPCTEAWNCHPAPDLPDFNLICVAGACQRVPRPTPPPEFATSCEIPDAMLVRGVRQLSGEQSCLISGAPGCWRQQRTLTCLVDEQCPAGFDCSVTDRCEGACVPRAWGRQLGSIPTSCSGDDAGSPPSDVAGSLSDATADAVSRD
ncbi:MAG: hypothetical protein Q8Q09_27345 [Deltaproteobacteria bacterium]|nr:hypothetical protein [Deltaproteobacteria bacterium]